MHYRLIFGPDSHIDSGCLDRFDDDSDGEYVRDIGGHERVAMLAKLGALIQAELGALAR